MIFFWIWAVVGIIVGLAGIVIAFGYAADEANDFEDYMLELLMGFLLSIFGAAAWPLGLIVGPLWLNWKRLNKKKVVEDAVSY